MTAVRNGVAEQDLPSAASTRSCHPRRTAAATYIRRATHHHLTNTGTEDITITMTPAPAAYPRLRATPVVAAASAAVAAAPTITPILTITAPARGTANSIITTCFCPTDPQTSPRILRRTRTTHASGTTPSPPARATTATGGGRHDPSTRKKRCTLSGTTGSTSARNGKKCARASTVSSPVDNDGVSRGSNVNSTDSSRRKSALPFESNDVCATASSSVMVRRWASSPVPPNLVSGNGPMFGTPGCVRAPR